MPVHESQNPISCKYRQQGHKNQAETDPEEHCDREGESCLRDTVRERIEHREERKGHGTIPAAKLTAIPSPWTWARCRSARTVSHRPIAINIHRLTNSREGTRPTPTSVRVTRGAATSARTTAEPIWVRASSIEAHRVPIAKRPRLNRLGLMRRARTRNGYMSSGAHARGDDAGQDNGHGRGAKAHAGANANAAPSLRPRAHDGGAHHACDDARVPSLCDACVRGVP